MFDKGSKRPLIVPIFIPNQGCPSRCVYCQQEKITARSTRSVSKRTTKEILDRAIRSPRFRQGREPFVAFYGGTFTNLPIRRMVELLKVVAPYRAQGFFSSVRVSTRPDSLGNRRLELMRSHGVSTVELGAQSMDNEVLSLSRRGHTSEDTVEAVYRLRQNGFKIGIQLMPGLPGDTEEKFAQTVEAVIRLRPDMVRLYPTLVIRGTELAIWYREKEYEPLGLEEAIRVCRTSCIRLESTGIPVIRMGLMPSPTLLQHGQILAGPWHQAFGFLVRSEIHLSNIEAQLPKRGIASNIRIRAPYREIPLVRGYRNRGIGFIEDQTEAKVTGVFPDESVPLGQIAVDIV